MGTMFDWLYQPWPWYVAGPLIGLFVPLLFIFGNKQFGISSSLRHACATCAPSSISYFNYEWKTEGLWNLLFVGGVFVGGFLGGWVFANPEPIALSSSAIESLTALGVQDFDGFLPDDIFNWGNLLTWQGLLIMLGGGFMVGFGARYAGGCTSGHAISGLSDLQLGSLVAVIGFFAGGLIVTHLIYPLLF